MEDGTEDRAQELLTRVIKHILWMYVEMLKAIREQGEADLNSTDTTQISERALKTLMRMAHHTQELLDEFGIK